jgi:hypothetical protein
VQLLERGLQDGTEASVDAAAIAVYSANTPLFRDLNRFLRTKTFLGNGPCSNPDEANVLAPYISLLLHATKPEYERLGSQRDLVMAVLTGRLRRDEVRLYRGQSVTPDQLADFRNAI